jgi:DNA-binding NtrC family response regulator
MKKICVIMNSNKHPERVSELRSILPDYKKYSFFFYDSFRNGGKHLSLEKFSLVLAHESDIETDEDAFYKALASYGGITVVFSGGITETKVVSERLYEINYTILTADFSRFIDKIFAGQFPDGDKIKLTTAQKNEKKNSLSLHAKLADSDFSRIFDILKRIKERNIIFVDDDIDTAKFRSGGDLSIYDRFCKAKEAAMTSKFDIAVIDYDLKSVEGNGIDLAKILKKKNNDVKIILLTGRDDFSTVYEAYSSGISHFISKSNFSSEYFAMILDIIEFDNSPLILGKSASMMRTYELISFYAGISDDILITGENGTGKELIAQSLYRMGGYKGKIVSLNCSGIPETLFESEMFGYREGAFTGAVKGGRKSPFEEAENGILFLDEIGELPVSQQVKLLRAVQERQIVRLGTNSPIDYNARLVFATNKDLVKEVGENSFRQDFYYRISGSEITVPPIRERKDDLVMLIAYFAFRFFKRNPRLKPSLTVKADESSIEELRKYHFPGNVRELEKIVNRSIVEMLISGSDTIKTVAPESKNRPPVENAGEGTEVPIEYITELLKAGAISSKGLKDEMKKKIIAHLLKNKMPLSEISGLFGLSEQSFRNLKSKLKI